METRPGWQMFGRLTLPLVVFVGLLCAAIVGTVQFGYNRYYVPEGKSLLLRYKGPPVPLLPGRRPHARPGQFASVDKNGDPLEMGILKELRGPGRHFYCPLWWERELVEDKTVKPGEVAVVTSKMGGDLPPGEFLVDGDLDQTEHKGILRRVFGPGRYRINPYAYDFTVIQTEKIVRGGQEKQAGWVSVPTGYVGVVTNLTDNPLTGAKTGIQSDVLPPGLYPINPNEQRIDVVNIGYREKSIISELKTDSSGEVQLDPSGEPAIVNNESGIAFPSNDGFPISMDFTAVWGIMPEQAPAVIRTFGDVEAVEMKVVVPQMESICRNMGSGLGAVDLLVGTSRQKFQEETSQAFNDVLADKGLTLLYGLVRHIYIPQEVRVPIQLSFVADEVKLTRDQEQITARTEAKLREAERKVELEAERVRVGTEKDVAKAMAEGNKVAQETNAETTKLVAAIDRQTADLEAQATVLRGEAGAQARQLQEEAKADKFNLAVEAFGSGEAYNLWVFATGLPEDIQLDLFYAGDGTFWTDLKGFNETMLGRQVQQQSQPGATPLPRASSQPRR